MNMSNSRRPSSLLADRLLLDIDHFIGSIPTRGLNTPHYIEINRNEIFNSLVQLYTRYFKYNSRKLKYITTSSINEEYLARVYISHWFLDLYLSIKHACRKHYCDLPLTYFYPQINLCIQTTTYDYYLVQLLNNFKPTKICGIGDHSLFVPIITNNPDWTQTATSNYFNITNFCADTPIFCRLVGTMNDSGWVMMQTYPYFSDNILGRPFWLLDFHEDAAFAWFPEKDNYNKDDLILAYILGVPCTPHMSVRDTDVPQQYPGNKPPLENQRFDFQRKIPERVFGNVRKRVIENFFLDIQMNDDVDIPVDIQEAIVEQKKKVEEETMRRVNAHSAESEAFVDAWETYAKVCEEMKIGGEVSQHKRKDQFTAAMYQIIDYMYYCGVIFHVDVETRMEYHWILIKGKNI